MATVITEAELLDALVAAQSGRGPANALTVGEMKRAMTVRIGEERIRAGLREFQAQGRLVVHHVLRPRLDGQMGPVPAYEVLPPKDPEMKQTYRAREGTLPSPGKSAEGWKKSSRLSKRR